MTLPRENLAPHISARVRTHRSNRGIDAWNTTVFMGERNGRDHIDVTTANAAGHAGRGVNELENQR